MVGKALENPSVPKLKQKKQASTLSNLSTVSNSKKRNDWLPVDTCPQAANLCFYFEFENELKFYNPEASQQT